MNIIHTHTLTSLPLGGDGGRLPHVLAEQITAIPHDRLFVLTDSTTVEVCWPVISGFACVEGARMITIASTDEAKNVESLCHVWSELGRMGGSRRSLLVNLGGGMVTDLGGFAASTFKRGIPFINIPTTLLAMVDASVGGKTGINFGGLKNEVGVFRDADAVIICTDFLRTLDRENLLSGYAEMLKHGIISDERHLADVLTAYDVCSSVVSGDVLAASVAVKQRIVTEDPHEHGLRKALNLGHTVGHALESFAMSHKRPVLHGYAVAWGLVCELYLSVVRCGFPVAVMRQIVRFIRENYGTFVFTCDDYDELFALMTHDKKNHDGQIICTLMAGVGDIRINQRITRQEIDEMFDFLREG